MSDETITEPFLIRLKAVIDAEDNDWNVSNLAVASGLSNSTIRIMFRDNRSPRVKTMRQICAAMGTTLEEFMSEAETPAEKEIVRLVMQLPEHLRRQLLGYGQALLENEARPHDEAAEENQ